MESTITAAGLDAVSLKLWSAAREYAHGRFGLEGTPDERAQDFAQGYVLAVAIPTGFEPGQYATACANTA